MVSARQGPAALGALLGAAALVALAATSGGFSTGNAPAARTGCGPQVGCHGAPMQPSPVVLAVLQGQPAAYTPGAPYALGVSIGGAPPPVLPVAQNQGGFALEVSAGALQAADDAAQAEGVSATHTESGNDQRAWDLLWTAPAPGTGEVTFYLSVNAVNGNGLPDPGDQWSMATFTSAEGAAPPPAPVAAGNDTAPPPAPQATPGWEVPEAGVAVALVAVAARSRTRRRT